MDSVRIGSPKPIYVCIQFAYGLLWPDFSIFKGQEMIRKYDIDFPVWTVTPRCHQSRRDCLRKAIAALQRQICFKSRKSETKEEFFFTTKLTVQHFIRASFKFSPFLKITVLILCAIIHII